MTVPVVIDVYFIMDIFMYVCNFEYVSTIYKKVKLLKLELEKVYEIISLQLAMVNCKETNRFIF